MRQTAVTSKAELSELAWRALWLIINQQQRDTEEALSTPVISLPQAISLPPHPSQKKGGRHTHRALLTETGISLLREAAQEKSLRCRETEGFGLVGQRSRHGGRCWCFQSWSVWVKAKETPELCLPGLGELTASYILKLTQQLPSVWFTK